MKLKLFTLSFSKTRGGFDDTVLREFLEDKKVISCQQNAFLFEGQPYWAVLVKYTDDDEKRPAAKSSPAGEAEINPKTKTLPAADDKQGRPQSEKPPSQVYAPIGLSKKETAVYEALRHWRAKKSKALGIPLYAICNNRELEAVVRSNPPDQQALKSLKGLRSAFVMKYGDELIKVLHNAYLLN